MLLAKLVVDLSDLRDMRDAGEITPEEYEAREREAREEFRRKEAEAFADQMTDIAKQLLCMKPGKAD